MRACRTLAAAIFVVAALGVAQSANAGVVLEDDFTSAGQIPNTLDWSGDDVFASLFGPSNTNNSSTDLVGASNPWGITSFNGVDNVVDMDGSTGGGNAPSGILQSWTSLPTGDYTVGFWLSGNQRGADPASVTVSLGSDSWTSPLLASDTPWTWEVVRLFGGGQLTFAGSGPSNNQGDLIGGVVVSVPEASTWAMMTLGFAGLGFAGFRNDRKRAAIA